MTKWDVFLEHSVVSVAFICVQDQKLSYKMRS